jgi:hypothetical protein
VNDGSMGVLRLDSSARSECFGKEDLLLMTAFAHQLALAIAKHELKVTLRQNTDVLERLLTNFSPSGVTQKRPMRVTSKAANENEARGR